jgi:hypothetical protein
MGERMDRDAFYRPPHYTEVSDQFQVSAAFASGKQRRIFTGQALRWTSVTAWDIRKSENS